MSYSQKQIKNCLNKVLSLNPDHVEAKKLLDKINCPQTTDMVFLEDLLAGVNLFQKALAIIKSILPFSILYLMMLSGW